MTKMSTWSCYSQTANILGPGTTVCLRVVMWCPCFDRSELFWWQVRDLHKIKQVVLLANGEGI